MTITITTLAFSFIFIFDLSMYDTYSDEYGFLDFQRSQHGSGMSQKSQAKRFVSELNRVSDNTGNSLFNVSQLRDIAKVNTSFVYNLCLCVSVRWLSVCLRMQWTYYYFTFRIIYNVILYPCIILQLYMYTRTGVQIEGVRNACTLSLWVSHGQGYTIYRNHLCIEHFISTFLSFWSFHDWRF